MVGFQIQTVHTRRQLTLGRLLSLSSTLETPFVNACWGFNWPACWGFNWPACWGLKWTDCGRFLAPAPPLPELWPCISRRENLEKVTRKKVRKCRYPSIGHQLKGNRSYLTTVGARIPNIRIPNILKFGFWMVRYSNGPFENWTCSGYLYAY